MLYLENMVNEIFSQKNLIFGHRGIPARMRENTMEGFWYCREHGLKYIELDVHVIKTGELAVLHDFTLKRLFNDERKMKDLTLEEVRELNIPLLEDIFHEFGDFFTYDIELKHNTPSNNHIADKVLDLIDRYGLQKHVVISSFDPLSLRRFSRLSRRSIDTALIFSKDKAVPFFLRRGEGRLLSRCTYLKPEAKQFDEKMRRKFRNYPIICWTVDDRKEMERCFRLGAIGVISNDALKLKDEQGSLS